MLPRDQRVSVRNWTFATFIDAVKRLLRKWRSMGESVQAIDMDVARKCYDDKMTVRATAAKFVK